MLALITGTASCLRIHLLVELHGQPGWVAAQTPLSIDEMIVGASTTLLADSRSGARGCLMQWALIVAGSAASLAANVDVAEPTVIGRVVAAWRPRCPPRGIRFEHDRSNNRRARQPLNDLPHARSFDSSCPRMRAYTMTSWYSPLWNQAPRAVPSLRYPHFSAMRSEAAFFP